MSNTDDWDEDGHQSYKDGLAMDYINEDGSQREPPEPDLDAIAYEEHCRDVHDGGACNCPIPSPEEVEAQWKADAERHRAGFHGGGECDCEAPF